MPEKLTQLERLFIALENGNLTDARLRAKRFGPAKIVPAFIECGYTSEKAKAASNYLKGRGSFQTYCDTP